MPDTLNRPARPSRATADRIPPAPRPAPAAPVAGHAPAVDGYRPFGNMESRNGLQERVEIPLLLRALRLSCGGRVLEVGCGRGIALPLLSQRLQPAELVGLDIDPHLIAAARHRMEGTGTAATLQVGDVRAMPFDSASFDLVIDFGTCYHLGGGLDGPRRALREISRVLRVGGLLVHETRVAQLLAHPVRSFGLRLPWSAVPTLALDRGAVLWAARRRVQ